MKPGFVLKQNRLVGEGRVTISDYALVAICVITAAFSGGQAVVVDRVSLVSVAGCLLGITFSYMIRQLLEGTKFLKLDGILYLAACIGVILSLPTLNMAYPPETFPRELMPTSWLLWMLVFGSFFLWNDKTLLFHSIPSLAIFGFVGCYDTFRAVVFFFFLYLICLSILFARAHARDMQQRAAASGFFELDPRAQNSPELQMKMLKDGPWRWAAGPEWALWSALGIVLLSLLGAPVVQIGVKPISGSVQVNNPLTARLASTATTVISNPSEARVGSGPVNLRPIELFHVVTEDQLTPFRTDAYDLYTGRGWRKVWQNVQPFRDLKSNLVPNAERIVGQVDRPYLMQDRIIPIVPSKEIPQRGMKVVVGPGRAFEVEANDVWSRGERGQSAITVDYVVSRKKTLDAEPPALRGNFLASTTETGDIPTRIYETAQTLAKNSESKLRAAEKIRNFISKTLRYNKSAAAVPGGRDVAEFMLFEQKEAYCDAYATLMVLMARSAGIPARYAVGYLPSMEDKTKDGALILRESDRHAWAELFFQGLGWVVFDATEGTTEVPGNGRRDAPSANNHQNLMAAIFGGLMASSIVAAFLAFSYFRRKDRPQNVFRAELETHVLGFTEGIRARTAARRQVGQTLTEYVKSQEERLAEQASTASEMANELTDLLYAPSNPSKDMLSEIGAKVKNLNRELVAAAAAEKKSQKGKRESNLPSQ